jgi:hypothetical protein
VASSRRVARRSTGIQETMHGPPPGYPVIGAASRS